MSTVTSPHDNEMPYYRTPTPMLLVVETSGTTTAQPLGHFITEPRSSTTQTIHDACRAFIASTSQTTSDADATTSILITDGMEMLQTEDELDQFQNAATEFLTLYDRDGISAMGRRLLHCNDPELEPLARRFLRALGQQRSPAFNGAATNTLLGQINSHSGGRRSAAAAALGAFPSPAIMLVLQDRSAVETNKFVKAGIDANLRVFKANGISAPKAV
jgi:hypothetical protein